MTILFLALWLQMSAPTTGISHLGSATVDHGKVLSTQIACIKTYADGFIEYNPCEISTWGTDRNGGTAVPILLNQAAQRAADETDGKPLLTAGEPIRYCLENEFITIEGKELATCDKGQWVISDWMKRAAEPVDVPAVPIVRWIKPSRQDADFIRGFTEQCESDGGSYISNKGCELSRYTCDPKSRILEHDENSPPKYWCRKVEF